MGQAGSAEAKQPNQRDIKPVDVETRSMLQRGVKHNMKIVIRGAQKAGKTSLFRRLQGLEFSPDYVTTDEIQTAVLSWTHKSSGDVVKVELWDVVDKACNFNEAETDAQRCASAVARGRMGSQRLHKLDAETVDVYKGTDGAILIYDSTRHETFDYAVDQLAHIPAHVAILLLASFRDCQQPDAQTVVSTEQIRSVLQEYRDRIAFLQVSCANDFGVSELRSFLALPFLRQRMGGLSKQLDEKLSVLTEARAAFDARPLPDYSEFTKALSHGPPQPRQQRPAAHAVAAPGPAVPSGGAAVAAPSKHGATGASAAGAKAAPAKARVLVVRERAALSPTQAPSQTAPQVAPKSSSASASSAGSGSGNVAPQTTLASSSHAGASAHGTSASRAAAPVAPARPSGSGATATGAAARSAPKPPTGALKVSHDSDSDSYLDTANLDGKIDDSFFDDD